MEAQGAAEVRRLHIIYFLSRKGCVEHPHLIRVHHLSRNGIRLRDIKRWLAELRGKDMPESFAWSYKRRYKTGYVWQDLLDDDLITPISDNEYVLKGSEICSFTSTIDNSYDEKKISMQKEPSFAEEAKEKSKEEKQESLGTSMVVSRKSSSEIEEELPHFGSETSTLTDDSMKLEEEKHSEKIEQDNYVEENDHKLENSSSSSIYSTLLNKKTKKNINNITMEKTHHSPSSTTTPSSSNSTFSKSKSYSNGASQIFRNLITCGAVDTHDSAMVAINRRNKPSMNMSSNKVNNHSGDICKREKVGGSERIFGTSWNRPEENDARKSCDGVTDSMKFCSPRTSSAAYMPVNGPTCSQCGKQFKPEKLHRHMKSCKGMKAIAKGISPAISADSAEKTSQGSTESSHEHSISGYYLTH